MPLSLPRGGQAFASVHFLFSCVTFHLLIFESLAESHCLRSKNVIVGSQVDVYSYGILLFEVLSGRVPFHDLDMDPAQLAVQVRQS